MVEVEASRIQSSLLYVTRLLTATMRSHAIASDRMRSWKKTFLSRLSEFLKMHREQEAGQKVCLKCFFMTTVNRFHIIFSLSQKGRNKKWDSFYTAKCVSSVHSCRDETRLAVFSVPFPQNKFQTCFFLAGGKNITEESVCLSSYVGSYGRWIGLQFWEVVMHGPNNRIPRQKEK